MAEDNRNKPLYMISVAAELTGMHPQTLRVYESKGLVNPQRSGGNTRLYSRADIERLELINQLTDEGICDSVEVLRDRVRSGDRQASRVPIFGQRLRRCNQRLGGKCIIDAAHDTLPFVSEFACIDHLFATIIFGIDHAPQIDQNSICTRKLADKICAICID